VKINDIEKKSINEVVESLKRKIAKEAIKYDEDYDMQKIIEEKSLKTLCSMYLSF
jgi:hypothetical protein